MPTEFSPPVLLCIGKACRPIIRAARDPTPSSGGGVASVWIETNRSTLVSVWCKRRHTFKHVHILDSTLPIKTSSRHHLVPACQTGHSRVQFQDINRSLHSNIPYFYPAHRKQSALQADFPEPTLDRCGQRETSHTALFVCLST